MGRLGKLKRQAILEANQRNLGILTENPTGSTTTLDATEKVVSDHTKELEKEIESMTKKLESLVMDKNISKMQFKKTLSDLKKERKLMKTQKKLERQIEKAEKDVQNIEGKDPEHRHKVGEAAKKLAKLMGAEILALLTLFKMRPDFKDKIFHAIDQMHSRIGL